MNSAQRISGTRQFFVISFSGGNRVFLLSALPKRSNVFRLPCRRTSSEVESTTILSPHPEVHQCLRQTSSVSGLCVYIAGVTPLWTLRTPAVSLTLNYNRKPEGKDVSQIDAILLQFRQLQHVYKCSSYCSCEIANASMTEQYD